MPNHVCSSCGVLKDFSEFNKILKSGPLEVWNLRYCKECAHQRYLKRYQNPSSRQALNESSVDWKKRNPDRHAELAREYRKRYPEKITAQNRLNYAIRKGIIQRKPCEVCGSTDKVHAHHRSYEEKDWYNVRWLCFVCHKLEHSDHDQL